MNLKRGARPLRVRRVRETDKMKLTDREQAMLDGAEGAGSERRSPWRYSPA